MTKRNEANQEKDAWRFREAKRITYGQIDQGNLHGARGIRCGP